MKEVLHFKSTKERLQYLDNKLEELVPVEAEEEKVEELKAEEPEVKEEKPKKKASSKKGKKKDEVQAE